MPIYSIFVYYKMGTSKSIPKISKMIVHNFNCHRMFGTNRYMHKYDNKYFSNIGRVKVINFYQFISESI